VDGPEGLDARSPLGPPARAVLTAWGRDGGVASGHTRSPSALGAAALPPGLDGAFALGPLHTAGRLCGVLALGGAGPSLPALCAAALDPLAVALANDARLHELARLREAAEQDRRALLSRLGRQDVSDAIVGEERGLRPVMARVDQVAPTDAPVLILGETGAGKEVVARAIHARSRRARGPFLRVNCGAIPTELVDSELFGHEKGSFTGAIGQRKGWFERADGGTLFLDEVGELPPAAQVRLLRVLQDGSFQRVGGQDTHTVDVRLVAATHRDLPLMVRDGRFRQDLWYRISVFPVQLPALRERRDDIPSLAAHFAARAGERLFGRPLVPSPADLAPLLAYPWPGNVRELAAVIERAAILGNGTTLLVGPALGGSPSVSPAPAAALPGPEDAAALEDALRRCHGRIEGPFGAAAALGVNPHTLRSRLRRLGIDWAQFRGRGGGPSGG
jgi:transcriptional regulator with GAF, ATPase, and Fis domain